MEYICITSEYKCAPQLCLLFHKVGGKKDILAYALEIQSLFMEGCSFDQLPLPGC